jgi:hypothetical protein
MIRRRPPYHLLDLPAVPFDVADEPLPARSPREDRERQWRECNLSDLPAGAKAALHVALTHLLASLEPIRTQEAIEPIAAVAAAGR